MQNSSWWDFGESTQASHPIDYHAQFCGLVGVPPSDAPEGSHRLVGPKTLYGRVLRQRSSQNRTYAFTAAMSNAMLLTQVVIGAAVTALGASESSHILITLFGATNTIIAGIVAYLKSRGQPMRARMFKIDLEHVVDEIENSEIMWLGITKRMHGYQEIDIDRTVTVRSEVARLTRLYDHAVLSNSMNYPDNYLATSGDASANQGLRQRLPSQAVAVLPSFFAPTYKPVSNTPKPAPALTPVAPDEAPAPAPGKSSPDEAPKSKAPSDTQKSSGSDTPAEPPVPNAPTDATPPVDGAANGKTKDDKKEPAPAPTSSDKDEEPATKA